MLVGMLEEQNRSDLAKLMHWPEREQYQRIISLSLIGSVYHSEKEDRIINKKEVCKRNTSSSNCDTLDFLMGFSLSEGCGQDVGTQ